VVSFVNVYDFDNTLYYGESSIDFSFFLIRNNKRIILWLPKIFWNLIIYKLCLVNRDKLEKTINDFLKIIIKDKDEFLDLIKKFWVKNKKKLNTDIIKQIKPEDAIISAGPYHLLDAIRNELGTSNLICSEIDLDKKLVTYLNFSSNKVKRYHETYGDTSIDKFYTDSYNDKAMMDISDKVYLVKKGKIKCIK